MNPSDLSAPQTRASSPYRDYNPRKRGRTACTRCKTRKQKCDNEYPVCSNCLRAGAECDKASTPDRYTRALEERIAYLESQLESGTTRSRTASNHAYPVAAFLSPHAQDTAGQGQTGGTGGAGSGKGNGIDHNAVGELVGFLAINSSEAPAYIGSSSGLSLAANLGEMVQATVWNQVLSSSRNQPSLSGEGRANAEPRVSGLPPQPTPSDKTPGLDRPRTLRMEELLAKSTEPPNDEMGGRILHAYLTRLHVRYPFLDRKELWRLHEDRWRLAKAKREELAKSERFGIFKLYLSYAIGATTMQLSEKYDYVPPERFYITALQQVPAMCETRSVENVEAMTLLVVYHLRSASSQGVWYMIGLAMRTAIDLGLHRKANEINLDPITAQMRRRLFWTVYYLERVVSVSLGRPFSIADRHIDLPLPVDVDDDVRDPALLPPESPPVTSPEGNSNGNSSNSRITSLTFSIYLITLRRIDSRIQHKIYRADKPLHLLRSKMDRLFLELEEWKASALQRFTGSDLDYPMLHYNRALRLLIQPFLPSLPLTDPYYHICLRAAGDICQTHKRLHQTLEYGHSFLAVQTVFISGITLLYALWTHSDQVWSVRMSNDIRACSTVLFVMGERATWVKKYRDAFELLVNAAMEKLQGNETAKKAGMAELMTAQHAGLGVGPGAGYGLGISTPASPGQNPNPALATASGYPSTAHTHHTGVTPNSNLSQGLFDPASQDHGVRMALQLAPWIDLEDGHGPFWVPDFETLENFSGNLWSAGDPTAFNPL
ncbi:fungal-specific transcription factor domain-containing protein [Aspergillus similis]